MGEEKGRGEGEEGEREGEGKAYTVMETGMMTIIFIEANKRLSNIIFVRIPQLKKSIGL